MPNQTKTTSKAVQDEMAIEQANRIERATIEQAINAIMAQNNTNIAKLAEQLHKASINKLWLPDFVTEKDWISAKMPSLDYNKGLRLRKCFAHETIGPHLAELGYSRANALWNSKITVTPEMVSDILKNNVSVAKIREMTVKPIEPVDELAELLSSRIKIAAKIEKLSLDLTLVDDKIKAFRIAEKPTSK